MVLSRFIRMFDGVWMFGVCDVSFKVYKNVRWGVGVQSL